MLVLSYRTKRDISSLIRENTSKNCNISELSKKLYEHGSRFFESITSILLLSETDAYLTPYYVTMLKHIDYEKRDKQEIKSLIENVISKISKETIVADIYIMMHRILTKYMTFKKHIVLPVDFLIKNMMLGFRDYLRVRGRYDSRIGREQILKNENLITYDKHSFDFLGQVLSRNDVWSFMGTQPMPKMLQYILYLKYTCGWRNSEVAKHLGYSKKVVDRYMKKQSSVMDAFYHNLLEG